MSNAYIPIGEKRKYMFSEAKTMKVIGLALTY